MSIQNTGTSERQISKSNPEAACNAGLAEPAGLAGIGMSKSKRRQIVDAVSDRIRSGELRPGDRVPSDVQLVQEFGVSRPTVAKALQELQAAGLVKRRVGAGTFVLRNDLQELRNFGLLIPGLGSTEIFGPICAQMAIAAQEQKCSILWGAGEKHSDSNNQADRAIELCDHFVRSEVAGVFFAPIEHVSGQEAINEKIVATFSKAKIPVVLLDRDYVAYPERSDLDFVGIDNRRVGYMITHHLFQQGCKRVLFLARQGSASTIDARIAGFMEAVVNDSGEFNSKLVHRCDPRDLKQIAKVIKQIKPNGIVCGNDVTAGELMHSLDQLEIEVPEEVRVAGVDDVRYAELLRVPLTTMHQPCAAIGEAAFAAMLDRVDNPSAATRDVLLSCELVVRASTA